MDNRWMYIDFNSYFASVEQQIDPNLRNKPVAVIPVNSDATCVIAASYEAKAFNIKTGTPVWEAKKLCPHLICVLVKHQMYVEFHEKILKEIDRHVPITRVWSIDEVACQLMDNEGANATQLAKKIKQGLKENVGECIRCSIGIAPNRYLAKVATDMQKPDGLVYIYEKDLPQKLYSLKLCDLPGIGTKMAIRLKDRGILDMKTFCSLSLEQMREVWGSIEGEKMWHRLKGSDIPDKETQRKSLGHSQVLPPELRNPENARIVGRRLTAKAASRLRRMGLAASKINLCIDLEEQGFFELSSPCGQIDDTFTFLDLFQGLWTQIVSITSPAKIKKISITFSKLERSTQIQYDFFTDHSKEKRKKISQTLDLIHQKYGKDSASLGILPDDSFSGTKIAFTRIPDQEEFLELGNKLNNMDTK